MAKGLSRGAGRIRWPRLLAEECERFPHASHAWSEGHTTRQGRSQGALTKAKVHIVKHETSYIKLTTFVKLHWFNDTRISPEVLAKSSTAPDARRLFSCLPASCCITTPHSRPEPNPAFRIFMKVIRYED